MPKLPRSCIETNSFEDCKKTLISKLSMGQSEFDEAYLFPMQQLIVYNPNLYPSIEDSSLRVLATDATPKYPSIYIAYTYDDENIYLQYAELKQIGNE